MPDQASKPADKPNPVKLWILQDRSSSMSRLRGALIEGTNELLDEQRDAPGRCRVSIVQFDSTDPLHIAVDGRRISRVRPMAERDYRPRGMTPLLDAVGALISKADRRIAWRKRHGRRSEDQTVAIITDGYENCSTDYTMEQIQRLIDARTEAGWAFVFLGANQDSFKVGGQMGVPQRNIRNWAPTEAGVQSAYKTVSRGLRAQRAMSAEERQSTRRDYFRDVPEPEAPEQE